MATTTIDQKIRQLCRETGEPDFKNYDTILSHVRGALIDLQLYVMPCVTTEELKADHLKNLHWPCDCVKPLLVGLKRKGRICNVSVDSGISSASDGGCSSMGDVEADIQNTVSGGNTSMIGFYYDGVTLSGYGNGYDKVNAVTHDKERRITNIKFKTLPGDTFQFTFIDGGISKGVSHIPIEAESCIDEYVFWKYYRRTDRGLSDRSRENYKQEYYRLRKFYQDTTIEDWIRAVVKR